MMSLLEYANDVNLDIEKIKEKFNDVDYVL